MLIVIAILLLALFVFLGLKKPGIALITSPFVSFLLFCISGEADSVAAMAIAPIIFFVTLIAVVMSRREPDSEQWPQITAKCILIGIVCSLILVTAVVVFGPLGFFVFVFFVIFIGSVISYGLTSRHATAAYVISTIGSSMRQNLPLPMALESAASGRADSRARILRRIKKWLVQGCSLSESLKRGYPKCPGYAAAMIAAAERIDQLPLAIGAIEADMAVKADESRKVRPIHPLYPVVLIVFMFFMLWALMTFVIPQFESILAEMLEGAQLPVATRVVLNITHFIAYEIGWLVWAVIAFIVFVVVPVSIRIRFRPRRAQKPYLISQIGDFIKWHLPILHWFEKNYSMVQMVELLRLSLNAGCTVNDAIANTLNLDVNNRFKKRLQKWLTKVEAGNNIAVAARESRLGNTLAWAFSQGGRLTADDRVNQGNTLAILETLESFYRSNYNYRVNLARFIMWPCVTLIMGAMVGFIVYAIFSPMVTIINHLANLVTP